MTTIVAGTTVTSSQVVSSGYLYEATTVSSGGDLSLSGGEAVETTVLSGGMQEVFSGGVASGTIVSSEGGEYVWASGVASGTIVLSGGEEVVFSGGVASGTTVNAGGYENVQSGGVASGTIVSSGGTQYVAGSALATVLSGGAEWVFSGGVTSGTIVLSGGAEVVSSGGVASGTTVTAGGYDSVESGGVASDTVVLAGGYEIVNSGGVTTGTTVSSGGEEYVLSDGDALSTTVSSGGVLDVASGGTIFATTLVVGGTIDFKVLSYSSAATVSVNTSTDVLTVTDGTTTYTTMLSGDYSADTFALVSASDGSLEVVALCYYPGTKLATPEGEIAVEDVTEGTLLMTAEGVARPVRWVGQSNVSTRFADPFRSLPIRIKAGALAEGLPGRDLLVSPDHALFLDGVLVQAAALVNGVSIVREADVPECFTYYHVELADHVLLIAEGVPAESFVDNVDRMNFVNWSKRLDLETAAPMSELPYPRAQSHRQVPQVLRRRLEARKAGFLEGVAEVA